MSLVINETKVFLGSRIRYGEHQDEEGQPVIWFVLKDVCDALGIKNSYDLKARLQKDHGACLGICEVTDALGRPRQTTIVLEDCVYSWIVPRSRKPGAIQFSRWVGRVIRTVRQTGRYERGGVGSADVQNTATLQSAKARLLEANMQMITMAQTMFPNDTRLRFLAQEKLASMMGTQASAVSTVKPPLTITEIMEKTYPVRFVQKNRSFAGRLVAKQYRLQFGEPPTTAKLVNGHSVSVKIYPAEHHPLIREWIHEVFDSCL